MQTGACRCRGNLLKQLPIDVEVLTLHCYKELIDIDPAVFVQHQAKTLWLVSQHKAHQFADSLKRIVNFECCPDGRFCDFFVLERRHFVSP